MDPDQLAETCGSDPSWICQTVLDASGNESLARTLDFLLDTPLRILFILVLAIAANRLMRRGVRNITNRIAGGGQPGFVRVFIQKAPAVLAGPDEKDVRAASRARTIGQVLRSIGSVVIYSAAILMILGELGVNLGPLIAGAGIAGVAIGFGAQSLVKDVISGIFMLLEDQYGVGDVIDLGAASGQVEAVTLRATRLRDGEGTVWHVPNGEIRRVGNMSQQWARAVVDVTVSFGADVSAATEVIERVARELRAEPEWARRIQDDPQVLGIEALGPDGMNIRLTVQTEPGEQWAIMRELRLRLWEALDEAGIEGPYQRRDEAGEDEPPAPAG